MRTTRRENKTNLPRQPCTTLSNSISQAQSRHTFKSMVHAQVCAPRGPLVPLELRAACLERVSPQTDTYVDAATRIPHTDLCILNLCWILRVAATSIFLRLATSIARLRAFLLPRTPR